jgi:flagellar biosynthesis/type III secretory pathway chaperone
MNEPSLKMPPSTMESLSQIIESHISCAHELLEVLQRERKALISGKPEHLEEVSTAKLQSVHGFQLLSDKLTRYLSGESIESLLSRIGGGLDLRQRWQDLMALATECQQTNLANGALLDERQNQVRYAIKCLFGHEAKPGIYGRWGDSTFRPERRIIASA